MNILKTFTYSSLMVLAALTACSKEDDTPVDGVGGSMTATVDERTWAATATTYNAPNIDTVVFTGSRDATSTDARGIGVLLASYNGTGSYPVGGKAKVFVIDNNIQYSGNTGTVDVTLDNDTWFKATFNFTATDSMQTVTKNVTGSFSYRKKV